MSRLKILRINSIPNFAKEYLEINDLLNQDYEELIKIIMSQNFAHPGSWTKIFNSLDIKSFDVIPNYELIQRKWLNKYYPTYKYNYIETIYKQIEFYKPNVLFIYAGAFTDCFPIELRGDLKKKFPFLKIITGLWGDYLIGDNYKSAFSDLDFIFTNCKLLEKKINTNGLEAIHLGNAFDPFVLDDHQEYLDKRNEKIYDVIFSGESGYNKFDHIERYHFLKFLMINTNLTLFAEEYIRPKNFFISLKDKIRVNTIKSLSFLPSNVISYFSHLNKNFRINRVLRESILYKDDKSFLTDSFQKDLPLKDLFPDRVNKLTYTIRDYYNNIKKSKIGINIHRNDETDVGNIRTFEVTGLNSLLLTDKGEQLKDYFKLNDEYVSYKDEGDCLDKIKYFLKNEKELNEIANNGMKKCLSKHTVKNRCELIKEVLEKKL